MSDGDGNAVFHLDEGQLDRYRRRVAAPDELLAADAHLATCDRCYAAVRADAATIDLPDGPDDVHVTYDELEAFVDGRADGVDAERVALHTEQCTRCGAELADLTAMRDSMSGREPVGRRRVAPRVTR